MLRRNISPELASFRSLLLREILISRDQVNLHREIVDVGHEKLQLWVEGATAPIHSSEIAWNGNDALHARRSEDSIRSQARQAFLAGVSLSLGGPPGFVGGELLTNKRWGSNRKWLRPRSLLLMGVTLRNSSFLDLKYRHPGFTIKNKEIASLVALNEHGHVGSVAVQSC